MRDDGDGDGVANLEDAFPTDLELDRRSERAAATNSTELKILDASTYLLLETHTPEPCPQGHPNDVGFSRGGALAFVTQACSLDGLESRVDWVVVEP